MPAYLRHMSCPNIMLKSQQSIFLKKHMATLIHTHDYYFHSNHHYSYCSVTHRSGLYCVQPLNYFGSSSSLIKQEINHCSERR